MIWREEGYFRSPPFPPPILHSIQGGVIITNQTSKEINEYTIEEIHVRIAEKIREDSRTLSRLTDVGAINELLSELDQEKADVKLTDMQENSLYKDIKSVAASESVVFLYSDNSITSDQAEILAQAETINSKICEKVIADSRDRIRVTPVKSLSAMLPELEPDMLMDKVSSVLEDDRFSHIKSVVASTGSVYIFSETYISRSYANILVLAEVNDPCSTIASTVRDEARIYPRVTIIEYFKNPVFNINSDKLEEYIASTLERPEFKDVKLIEASTGARYLYSDLYMNEELARSQIEWQEVDQFENQ
ncbi:hypothetical protein ACFLUP_04395 [Chloroflexota bacterium]